MAVGGLADRYARALRDLGTETNRLKELQKEISGLAALYRWSPDVRQLLENPAFLRDERKAVLGQVAESLKLSRTATSFALLLVDKDRTRLLPDIARAMERLTDAEAGVLPVTVRSAVEMTKAQLKKLTAALNKLADREVNVHAEVDPGLIGGAVVEMAGRLYDGSVKKRLVEIRESILRGEQ